MYIYVCRYVCRGLNLVKSRTKIDIKNTQQNEEQEKSMNKNDSTYWFTFRSLSQFNFNSKKLYWHEKYAFALPKQENNKIKRVRK